MSETEPHRVCAGFPGRGGCTEKVRRYPDGRLAWWCKDHDEQRIAHISANLKKMEQQFSEKVAE